jgi:hypothetical protein
MKFKNQESFQKPDKIPKPITYLLKTHEKNGNSMHHLIPRNLFKQLGKRYLRNSEIIYIPSETPYYITDTEMFKIMPFAHTISNLMRINERIHQSFHTKYEKISLLVSKLCDLTMTSNNNLFIEIKDLNNTLKNSNIRFPTHVDDLINLIHGSKDITYTFQKWASSMGISLNNELNFLYYYSSSSNIKNSDVQEKLTKLMSRVFLDIAFFEYLEISTGLMGYYFDQAFKDEYFKKRANGYFMKLGQLLLKIDRELIDIEEKNMEKQLMRLKKDIIKYLIDSEKEFFIIKPKLRRELLQSNEIQSMIGFIVLNSILQALYDFEETNKQSYIVPALIGILHGIRK